MQLDRLSRSAGRMVRVTGVKDLRGIGTKHLHRPALRVLNSLVQVAQEYYPDMAAGLYLVSAPAIFKQVWRLIRPMLNEHTAGRINIVGTSPSEIREVLLSRMPATALPREWGGACDCENGCLPLGRCHSRFDPRNPLGGYVVPVAAAAAAGAGRRTAEV